MWRLLKMLFQDVAAIKANTDKIVVSQDKIIALLEKILEALAPPPVVGIGVKENPPVPRP